MAFDFCVGRLKQVGDFEEHLHVRVPSLHDEKATDGEDTNDDEAELRVFSHCSMDSAKRIEQNSVDGLSLELEI